MTSRFRAPPVLSALAAALLSMAGHAAAQPAEALTMDRIMADPDWIGPAVDQAWWSWDGTSRA